MNQFNKLNKILLSKMSEEKEEKNHTSGVRCHLSHAMCNMSIKPTATATDPLPANSHTMYSRIGHKEQKIIFFRGPILDYF